MNEGNTSGWTFSLSCMRSWFSWSDAAEVKVTFTRCPLECIEKGSGADEEEPVVGVKEVEAAAEEGEEGEEEEEEEESEGE